VATCRGLEKLPGWSNEALVVLRPAPSPGCPPGSSELVRANTSRDLGTDSEACMPDPGDEGNREAQLASVKLTDDLFR
jgi:hypothetical protein